ncbi:hypothetical protein GCM10025762_10500 [Haloechinothrix salitolerans]
MRLFLATNPNSHLKFGTITAASDKRVNRVNTGWGVFRKIQYNRIARDTIVSDFRRATTARARDEAAADSERDV